MSATIGYNVLIVDDEPLFRLALRTLLTSSGLPLTITGEAADGEEALRMVQRTPAPDLIFIDMKMPRMNGIDFLARLSERAIPEESAPVCIALSSYQDYAFVREAFLLGALDYMVKVDMDERHVVAIVDKALRELQKKRRKQAAEKSISEEKKDLYLRQLLEAKAAILPELEAASGIRLSEGDRVVAVIRPDRAVDSADPFDENGDTFRSILEQALQSKELHGQTVRMKNGDYAILLVQLETRSQLYFRNRMNEWFTVVQRRLLQYANLMVTIGLSSHSPKAWCELYQEAAEAAGLRFFCGLGKVHYPESRHSWGKGNTVLPFVGPVFSKQADQVLDALTEADSALWLDRYQEWRKKGTPSRDEREIREQFSDVVWKLGAFLHARECRWDHLEEPFRQPFGYLETALTLEQLWERLKKLIEAVHAKVHEASGGTGGLLQQAKAYIDKHYCDGITLTLVSQWVGVSESHLSKLFVKETGEKFIDYLTRIRIRRAMELMKTDLKLYEIAEQVGYPNPEHFSRLFKKETGRSPAQFREQWNMSPK